EIGIWNSSQLFTPGGAPAAITTLAEAPNGDLLAVAGYSPSTTWRFDGTTWSNLGIAGPDGIRTMVVGPLGDIFVGGQQPLSTMTGAVARFQAGTWQTLAGPSAPKIHAIERLPNGDVV